MNYSLTSAQLGSLLLIADEASCRPRKYRLQLPEGRGRASVGERSRERGTQAPGPLALFRFTVKRSDSLGAAVAAPSRVATPHHTSGYRGCHE